MAWACGAAAQTTQPIESAWPRTVQSLAAALSKSDKPAAEGLLSSSVAITRFGTAGADNLPRLIGRAANGTMVGQHAYFHPPMVLAADLAADFKGAAAVPDEVKKTMIPEDDTQMKRANATAAQWVTEVLKVSTGQPVGIIVIWCDNQSLPGIAAGMAPPPELVFILLKGEEAAPNKFHINQIVYGKPVGDRN